MYRFNARFSCVLVAACLTAGPLHAERENIWMRFSDAAAQTGAGQTTYNREFIKHWENNPAPGFPTLSPANIEPTKAAVARYAEIVKRGGWPVLPDIRLEAGMAHPAVETLRRRLAIAGHLAYDADYGDTFDLNLDKGLKRFQAANGLAPTGVLDKLTLAALNVSAVERLHQLRANLVKLQALSRTAARKYIAVNIPAAQIEAVEGDRIVTRHAGVVGKIDRQTPELASSIHEMNFNPVWHLPPTVIDKDLIPKGLQQRPGESVLVKYGIDAYDGNGKKLDPYSVKWSSPGARTLQYRQPPGKDNPLGFVKINFNNRHAVYMHATPSTSQSANFRAASSGCVRVLHGMDKLALWLLADNGGWTAAHIERLKTNTERYDTPLRRSVPIRFVYITAWATPDGAIHFRRDLYGKYPLRRLQPLRKQ
ncbi:MAG: L,D-transpeptidase family protein [Hyphomicrobiaceae bacterium]